MRATPRPNDLYAIAWPSSCTSSRHDHPRRDLPAPEQGVEPEVGGAEQRHLQEPDLRQRDEQDLELRDPLDGEDQHHRERPQHAPGAGMPGGRLGRLVRVGRPHRIARLLDRDRGRRRRRHRLGAGDQEAAAVPAERGQPRQAVAVARVGVGIVGLVVGEARHARCLQVGDDDARRAPPGLEQRLVERLVAGQEVDRRLPRRAGQGHRLAVLRHEDEEVAHDPCPIQAAPSR